MQSSQPAPNPRLRAFDALIGEWDLYHRDLKTGETWRGRDQFTWMEGGYFLLYHHEEFGHDIKGIMIIGFEQRWPAMQFSDDVVGHWFEGSTGNHFVYFWDVNEKTVHFSFEKPDSPYRFLGQFNHNRSQIVGEWHLPDGSAYALTMTRQSAG